MLICQVFEVSDVTGTQREHEWVIKVTPLPPPSVGAKRKNKKDDALKKNADTLYMEQLVYKNYLMGVARIPALPGLLAYGEDQGLRFLVMQRLGRTLIEDFEANAKRYPPATLAAYGVQMLSSLQSLHERQLLFVDVKPENFMLGRGGGQDGRTIYMMDFGLVEKFVGTGGGHRVDSGGGGGGTPLFMSLSCHQGASPGRRDDLEALGLVLVMLARGGHLPWDGATSDADCLAKKKATSLADLVKGCAGGDHLRAFIELARATPYDAMPDYPRFQALLEKVGKAQDKTAKAPKTAASAAQKPSSRKKRAPASSSVAEQQEEEEEAPAAAAAKAPPGGAAKRGRRAPARRGRAEEQEEEEEEEASDSSAMQVDGPSQPPRVLRRSGSRSSSLGGGLLAMAANAGRFLMRSVGAITIEEGGGGAKAEDAEDDDDVIDLTDGQPARAAKSSKRTIIEVDDDDDDEQEDDSGRPARGGRGGGRQAPPPAAERRRGGKRKAAEEAEDSTDEKENEAVVGGSEASSSSSKAFMLEVRDGPHRGDHFVINHNGHKSVFVGQAADCAKDGGVSLPKDKQVKPKHCKLDRGKDARAMSFKVVPVGAGTATSVNGVVVSKAGRLVFPGDLIQLGSTTLMLRLATENAS